ncbi:hypothetical protein [Bradyrhizobium sp. SZCCHNR1070]|nr:hypothetical protein [Bradyrhizobium sp. SZCCHNR1070]
MSVSSTPQAEPVLTADRLRALLAAGGFASALAVAPGRHVLPVGSSIVLQFGDEMTRDEAGNRRITVKCSIVINGDDRRAARVTRWQLSRSIPMAVEDERFSIMVDADLLLGTVHLDHHLVGGEEALRHLQLLIADAQATLRNLPVNDRLGADARGPAVRIEARFSGDMVVGRSGVVQAFAGGRRPAALRATAQHIRMGVATCDCLAGQILPDVLRGVRAVMGPDRPPGLSPQQDADRRAWPEQVTLRETLQ